MWSLLHSILHNGFTGLRLLYPRNRSLASRPVSGNPGGQRLRKHNAKPKPDGLRWQRRIPVAKPPYHHRNPILEGKRRSGAKVSESSSTRLKLVLIGVCPTVFDRISQKLEKRAQWGCQPALQ